MAFLIGLLTFFMVINCLVLVLLVLMQLPKKEAGAGLAFGGAATDALFGAGSGNFLTKATKYSSVIFFGFALVLSVLQSHYFHRNSSEFQQQIEQQQNQAPAPAPAAPASSSEIPGAAPGQTNLQLNLPAETGNRSNAATPATTTSAQTPASNPAPAAAPKK